MSQVNFNKRRKSRSTLEGVLYEMRPYSLATIAAYSIVFPTHTLMAVSGGVLAVCAALIFSMRLRSRSVRY